MNIGTVMNMVNFIHRALNLNKGFLIGLILSGVNSSNFQMY